MSDKINADGVIISGAVISAVLVYYAGNIYGPGLTYDSISYLYAGVSLSEKGILIRPQGQPYIQWPPLYPVIIAVLNTLPGNLLRNIFYFQIAVAGCTVWIAGKLLQQLVQNKSVFIAAYIAIVFASPVILINHFVWSESVFVGILLLYISVLSTYLQQPSLRITGVLIVLGNLLCSQRLAGVYFIIGAFFLLLFYPRSNFSLNKFIRVCMFGAASTFSLFAWWIYNVLAIGNFLHEFVLIKKTHLQHFLDFNHVFTSWFLPQPLPVWLRIILVYVAIVLLLIFYERAAKNKQPALLYSKLYIIVLMSLFMSYFILLYISVNAIDLLDDRILAPVYIPGILLFFGLLDGCLLVVKSHWKKWLIAACLLWSIYPIVRTIHNVQFWHNKPVQPPVEQPVEQDFLKKIQF